MSNLDGMRKRAERAREALQGGSDASLSEEWDQMVKGSRDALLARLEQQMADHVRRNPYAPPAEEEGYTQEEYFAVARELKQELALMAEESKRQWIASRRNHR